MGTVYTIGESLLDIVFRNNKPVDARAGGSLLNASVSLGRLGAPVSFISEVGRDPVGDLICDFLRENGIATEHLLQSEGMQTPLALAFLDENNDAHYTFYKQPRGAPFSPLLPEPGPADILLFGSFFATAPESRGAIAAMIDRARRAGALVIYDPNYRPSHADALAAALPLIEENIAAADIVRGSNEDFSLIFGLDDGDAVYRKVASLGCANLVYTRGSGPLTLYTGTTTRSFEVPALRCVSTIGAGDGFNAGMADALLRRSIPHGEVDRIAPAHWEDIVQAGIACSADVCGGYDNYVSREFARRGGHAGQL